MRRSKAQGFSLLELLITVLIVGILATVALPNFTKSVEKAKVKDAQSVLASVASSERIYRLDQGSFGTLGNLTENNYIADPDGGNLNVDWDFAIVVGGAGTTFTAAAARTGGGYNGQTVEVDEAFTGGPVYAGKVYDGNHALRD